MKWWPFPRKPRQATVIRREAEERADRAEAEVKRPLREMRTQNHMTAALRRTLREDR